MKTGQNKKTSEEARPEKFQRREVKPKLNEIKWVQIVMFILIMTCNIGNNFGSSQDIVTETTLEPHYGINNAIFNQIFFAKSIGIILSGFLGPQVLDRYGFRKSYIFFIFVTFTGQASCTIGLYTKIFPIHLFGRM